MARSGRYRTVAEILEVKEVLVGDRRYVVCRNPQEVAEDTAARTTRVEKLESKPPSRWRSPGPRS